jgi:hypothetical protein
MSFGFVEVINSIEAEISSRYLPGAILWADKKFDGAWTKAMDRFDRALKITQERVDYTSLKAEAGFYKNTVLELIRQYKQEKGIEGVQSYLDAISSQTNFVEKLIA